MTSMLIVFRGSLFCFCIICFVCFQACNLSEANNMNDNYKVTLAPNGVYAIYNEEDVAILEGNIILWGEHEGILYGYQESYMYPDGISTTSGYFYFIRRDGEVREGLSKAQLISFINQKSETKLIKLKLFRTGG